MRVEFEEIGGQLRFQTFKKIDIIPRVGETFFYDNDTFRLKSIEWRVHQDDFIVRLFGEVHNE